MHHCKPKNEKLFFHGHDFYIGFQRQGFCMRKEGPML